MLGLYRFTQSRRAEENPTSALQHAARYIATMNSCSLHRKPSFTARLNALLSLGLLLRAART